MHYEELIREHAPKWPYPVHYGKENEVSCDVLVLGGGIAGCWASIGAIKEGARVVLVEKGATKTSGSGGGGLDEWYCANTNPACKVSPEEWTEANLEIFSGWRCGITTYIQCRESYDCLLEMEKIGVKIRDSEDEFRGAPFRDEKTKFLFCHDYENKYNIRVWGTNIKPSLYNECKRLGVNIYDRVMVTGLLTKGGKVGAKVIGATGVNVHTGEFYIFKGKASVLCMAQPRRPWIFTTEYNGFGSVPALSGDGYVMAWNAGAEFTGMEASTSSFGGPFASGAGVGMGGWNPCTVVDNNGKEIPWVDRDGRVLKTIEERNRPAPGQKFFIAGGGLIPIAPDIKKNYNYMPPRPMRTSGISEFYPTKEGMEVVDVTLPLYADIPSLPEMERKVVWRMMQAQESKHLIPMYRTFTQAGFNPDKDMAQVYAGGGPPQWRDFGEIGGGLVIDWDMKTTVDGLYTAGQQVFFCDAHAGAAATGRYAGRRAATYAAGAEESAVDRKQVAAEKARVYASVQRDSGLNWKELNMVICKVMQDYCPEVKNQELLRLGLRWYDELEASEAATACARNPHELMRILEAFNIMNSNRMILEASLARKASSTFLNLKRQDYPTLDPPEWHHWVTIKLDEGKVKAGKLPLDYHGDLVKNYEAHCGLKK